MATTIGTVRYHRSGDMAIFHVAGRATMPHGLPVRQTAEQLIDDGVRLIRVDLRDCTYMDSTFLGTLLTVRKRLESRSGTLTLVTPSRECVRILTEMGLHDQIPTCDEHIDEAAWIELKADMADPNSFRRNIAQAHEELAALPGPAGEQFQAVVRCLTKSPPPGE